MKKIILVCAAAVALIGCTSLTKSVTDPLITAISRINNTAIADLQTAIAVGKAATPPDNDGVLCATAAIAVAGQINAVMAAAKGTVATSTTTVTSVPGAPSTTSTKSSAGVFTTAELASIFAPGSAQYNAVQQQLTSGCAAKAQDVLGPAGLVAAGGVIAAIASGQILPLAAAM